MSIINFSDDACKLWQFLCQSCSVQLVYNADAMCDMKSFVHFERERQRARGELMLFVKVHLTESFQIIL